MSEPAKKPGQQPESYQPQKPEMMRALEEAQGDSAQIARKAQAISVEPSIISKRFSLIGAEGKIDGDAEFEPALRVLYQEVAQRLGEMRGLAQPVRMVGYWRTAPEDHNDVRYFAGVEADTSCVPEGLVALDLPDNLYAVFAERERGEVGGPEGAGYKWLEASMRKKQYTYSAAIPGDFEVYRNLTDTASD